MHEENTAQALTKDDFMQAVALAGGPKAVQAAFDGLRLANDQLDKEYRPHPGTVPDGTGSPWGLTA